MKIPSSILHAAGMVILLTSCAGQHPRPSAAPPIHSPRDLLKAVAAQTADLRDLTARAKLDIRIEGVRRKASAVIFHRHPRDLKMAVNAMGTQVLSAQARRDTLSVYLPQDNVLLSGPPDEVLFRITGVDLGYYEVHRALLGLSSVSPLDLPRTSRFQVGEDDILWEIRQPLWRRRLRFHRRTATLAEEQILAYNGDLLSRRMMEDYRDHDGVVLPRRVRIIQGEDRISLLVTRRTVNSDLTDESFREIAVPSNVTRYPIDG